MTRLFYSLFLLFILTVSCLIGNIRPPFRQGIQSLVFKVVQNSKLIQLIQNKGKIYQFVVRTKNCTSSSRLYVGCCCCFRKGQYGNCLHRSRHGQVRKNGFKNLINLFYSNQFKMDYSIVDQIHIMGCK